MKGTDVPRLNPDFSPTGDLTPEDYFVMTRVDGRSPARTISMISGFPEAKAMAILEKLEEKGAIYVGATPPKKRAPTGDDVDLAPEQRALIAKKHASLGSASLFDVLEIAPDADKRAIKRAYFRVSKDFHPDRFFGKKLGPYQQMLDEIFRATTHAFEILEDDARRVAYVERRTRTQGPAETALGLFESACQNEVTGNVVEALTEFASAIALDPQPRFLRRAAECALGAGKLSSAAEYATKFAEIDPRNALAHRTLAKVHRAGGRLEEARRELEIASRLDPESEHIAAELEEVRRMIG